VTAAVGKAPSPSAVGRPATAELAHRLLQKQGPQRRPLEVLSDKKFGDLNALHSLNSFKELLYGISGIFSERFDFNGLFNEVSAATSHAGVEPLASLSVLTECLDIFWPEETSPPNGVAAPRSVTTASVAPAAATLAAPVPVPALAPPASNLAPSSPTPATAKDVSLDSDGFEKDEFEDDDELLPIPQVPKPPSPMVPRPPESIAAPPMPAAPVLEDGDDGDNPADDFEDDSEDEEDKPDAAADSPRPVGNPAGQAVAAPKLVEEEEDDGEERGVDDYGDEFEDDEDYADEVAASAARPSRSPANARPCEKDSRSLSGGTTSTKTPVQEDPHISGEGDGNHDCMDDSEDDFEESDEEE